MKSVTIEITGSSPLLMHRYPLVEIEGLNKMTPEQQAEHAAYRDEKTKELFVPGVNLQQSLVEAAAYSKGKGRASLQKIAAACLFVSETQIALGQKEFAIDSRPVVIAATRGRIVRHRPRIDAWKFSFTLEYDEVLLSAKQVRGIVDDAGRRVGLLDFRPAKKGPFGRFVVTSWQEN